MNPIKSIRTRLGLTQAALAQGIGCTQGNIGHYENKGQTMPPDVAKRLIAFADLQGLRVCFDDIYADPARGGMSGAAAATECVAGQGA